MIALVSASIIYFPFYSPCQVQNQIQNMNLNLNFSACLPLTAWHDTRFFLWMGILWNSHQFLLSLFIFMLLFFSLLFGGSSWVNLPCFCPLFRVLWVLFPYFLFADPNSHLFCLNFCSILAAYQYVSPRREMSRNSFSSLMYFCIQIRYLSTICSSESLIPNIMHKVSKIFVSSCTSWSLFSCIVVQCVYFSS